MREDSLRDCWEYLGRRGETGYLFKAIQARHIATGADHLAGSPEHHGAFAIRGLVQIGELLIPQYGPAQPLGALVAHFGPIYGISISQLHIQDSMDDVQIVHRKGAYDQARSF